MNIQDKNTRFTSMAECYDRMAPRLVPAYDFLQDETIKLFPFTSDDHFTVIDLGAGSGILLNKILTKFNNAYCIYIDNSEAFAEIAKTKLKRFHDRISYIHSAIEDGWEDSVPEGDIIVSMSAIHHLEETEKKALYQRCWLRLNPGGWFFNIDEMKPVYDDSYCRHMRFWVTHVDNAESTIPPEEREMYYQWKNHFEGWKERNITNRHVPKTKGDDIHQGFIEQVDWLHEAGFRSVDCYIKYHLWAVIGGTKV